LNSKKPEPYNFNILSTANYSIPSTPPVKSSRETVFNVFISNMDYAEQVALMANKLSTSYINSMALQESTILLAPPEPLAVTQIAEENISVPQG